MLKLILSALILSAYPLVSMGQIQESDSFGSGANSFTIDFVNVGSPNNDPYTTSNYIVFGSVAYTYRMGKYEVSRDMITKANALGLGITMNDMGSYGGNDPNQPAVGFSWYEAAKFVNFLNTNKGYPPAYKFNGGTFVIWSESDEGYQASNKYRNARARYYLPSVDEYVKAAFGSPEGSWFLYSTGSNIAPTKVASGTSPNTSVFGNSLAQGPAGIKNAGGLSKWGTMAQTGNVNELLETSHDQERGLDRNNSKEQPNRYQGGGGWYETRDINSATGYSTASVDAPWNGFRIASIASTYVLTTVADSNQGTISKTPAKDYYLQDDSVTITAVPQTGYLFSSWSGASTATTSSIALTMNTDKTLTANFIQDGGDNDGDGLTNYQESITYGTNPNQKDSNGDGVEDGHAVSMGYNPMQNFSALVAHPPTGLYTASQMQTMAFGDLVLTKNANGSFTLNYDIEQSTDLQTWTPYQALSLPLTGLPTDKAFVRIKPKQ